MKGGSRPLPVQRSIITILMISLLSGCGIVKKRTTYGKNKTVTVESEKEDNGWEPWGEQTDGKTKESEITLEEAVTLEKADDIIETALEFTGVKYKYGGTTKRGMDCSGLLYVSFSSHDVEIPRVSHMIADQAETIEVNAVTRGDLLFFKTNRRGKRINHVGLVVAKNGDDIRFIHSTSSRGVIVSSLKEGYWNSAFVKAARIL